MSFDIMKTINLLESNGFIYDWSREFYYNKESKTVISREFTEANSYETIRDIVSDDWNFYFLKPPTIKKREEIIRRVGETPTL